MAFGENAIKLRLQGSEFKKVAACKSDFEGVNTHLTVVSLYGGKGIVGESFGIPSLRTLVRGGQRRVVYLDSNNRITTVSIPCRISVIERQLFNAETQAIAADKSTKERLGEIYKYYNLPDWDVENLRFGANLGYIRETGVQTASVALHLFPAYRRHTPGNLDLFRRTSGYLAIGNVFGAGGDTDVESAIVSIGIGIEVIRGVSLNIGQSVYGSEAADGSDISRRDKTVSVTLRSEFWGKLMGGDSGSTPSTASGK